MNNPLYKMVWYYIDPPCLTKHWWAAAIGAVVSIFSAATSASQGEEALEIQRQSAARAEQSRQDRLAAAKAAYDEYQAKFPANEMAMLEKVDDFTADENLSMYIEQGKVDVEQAYANAAKTKEREMTRYGMDPSDPRYQNEKKEMALDKAKAEVGAMTKARQLSQEDEDKNFAQRLALGNLGRRENPAMGAMERAYGSEAAGYSSDAARAGEQAGEYRDQAGESAGTAGNLIGGAIDDYQGQSGGDYSTDRGGIDGSGYGAIEPYTPTDSEAGELGW